MEIIISILALTIIIFAIALVFKTPNYERERLESNFLHNKEIIALFETNHEWDFYSSNTIKIPEFLAIKKPAEYPPDMYYQMISFDDNKKRILFVDYENKSYKNIDYEDFLDYTIVENNQTMSTTVGTVLENGIYGGFAHSNSTPVVDNLVLIIRLNKFDCPQITYKLMNPAIKYNRGSKEYQKLYSQLQNVVSLLEIIKKVKNN